jgi:hypothetical protein
LKINHRWSSWLVIATYLVTVGAEYVSGSHRSFAPSVNLPPESIGFNPCMMWERIPASARIATLVWFPTFLATLTQGFRNRAAARYLPILCLLAYGPVIQHQLWRIRDCYPPIGRIGFWILVASVCVMCLHHIIQRQSKDPRLT